MPKNILIQLDGDPHPSTFDAVVAVDAGAEVLLRHGGVTPADVVPLVHGVIFTRSGRDLASTAIFVGGSDVVAAEAVAERIRETFFGPVRVGVLVDPAGANTTAAAAVIAAGRHLPLVPGGKPQTRALVLGGTGPVGQRVARLLGRKGAVVHVASRSPARAEETVRRLHAAVPEAVFHPVEWVGAVRRDTALARLVEQSELIVSAGKAGVTMLPEVARQLATSAKVLIDLNAVPPSGIEGILPNDKARPCGAAVCYGAVGVGGLKMRIHRAAIERIFREQDAFLDAEELLDIGSSLA
jgi:predicted dinucleotide-binding enzyme